MEQVDVDFFNGCIDATYETFDTMLSVQMVRYKDPADVPVIEDTFNVFAIIGLTGKVTSRLVLSCTASVALRLSEKFLMEELDSLNEDVLDSMKELINIIAGAAAGNMQQYQLQLSLPVILLGNEADIHSAKGGSTVSVPFFVPECGPIHLEITVDIKK